MLAWLAMLGAVAAPWDSNDLDGDGKQDVWPTNGPSGRLERISYDNDGDGKPDEWVEFTDDRIVREVASKPGGRIDWRRTIYLRPNGHHERDTIEVLGHGGWQLTEEREYLLDRDLVEITSWVDGVATTRWTTATLH